MKGKRREFAEGKRYLAMLAVLSALCAGTLVLSSCAAGSHSATEMTMAAVDAAGGDYGYREEMLAETAAAAPGDMAPAAVPDYIPEQETKSELESLVQSTEPVLDGTAMDEIQLEENGQTASGESGVTEEAPVQETEQPVQERKLIRTVDMRFETTAFDAFLELLKQEVRQLNGYVESSDIGGAGQSDHLRDAYMVLRIPQQHLDAFLEKLETEGTAKLLRKTENVQDVTLTYYDIESRKRVLYVEQDRLLELLAQANSVESIIALEQRLSEIRYELEQYESRLRSYDNSVQYATVSIQLQEAKVLTATEDSSIWARMQSGFRKNLNAVLQMAEAFVVGIITLLPTLLVLGLVFVVLYHIGKRWRKSRHMRRASDMAVQAHNEAHTDTKSQADRKLHTNAETRTERSDKTQ